MDKEDTDDKTNKQKSKEKDVAYPEGGSDGVILKDSSPEENEYPLPTRSAIIFSDPLNTARVQLKTDRAPPDVKITSPHAVVDLLKGMGDYDRERIKSIHLDTKNQVLAIENLAEGTLNATLIHPREAVKGAILSNSASVIIAHNHPSGNAKPSKEDSEVAQIIVNAFDIMKIDVLDFLIITKTDSFSYRDAGIMPVAFAPVLKLLDDDEVEGESDACKLAFKAAREVVGENCGN